MPTVASHLTLLTGFPGFIGARLAGRLLGGDSELRIAALVEPRMAEGARGVAAGLDADRIEIVPADIAAPGLGIGEDDRRRLASEARSAFHLAAIYDLAVPAEAARRVNVDGTANVLELCAACERLERLNYVSTAYVAGDRTGLVTEAELEAGQGFKNHYEATKHEAEVLVRRAMDRIPTTIHRPAIVVGDSRTGDTQKFDGPYFLLRVIARAARLHLPIPRIGAGSAAFNVVPVDFVVEALARLAADPEAAGETLHLVDPEPLTAAEVTDIFAREYAGRPVRYRLPARLASRAVSADRVRAQLGGVPVESLAYLDHPVRFDTARAEAVLGRHGLRCPDLRSYAGALVRFFREHEDDPALVPGHRPVGTGRAAPPAPAARVV